MIDKKILDYITEEREMDTFTITRLKYKFNLNLKQINYYVKLERVREVAAYFLANPTLTLREVAENFFVSSSTVQRYLKSDLIDEIPEFNGKRVREFIELALERNRLEGKRKGGLKFAEKNQSLKDENSKFIGSKPRIK